MRYKNYLFALKAFNGMLLLVLNFPFLIKSGPYNMRPTNNSVRTICKSNIGSFLLLLIYTFGIIYLII